MKYINLIVSILLFFGCKKEKISTENQTFVIIEQNYDEALKIASKENKLIFIDFYTTWCAPCKELDKLVLQNDSIQQILNKDFILLRYNAENDTVFHLSKKHHVSSYPTALILNKKGYVVNRKYGFPGDDFETLSSNVLKLTNESVALNKENKTIKGYSNKIDASKYPKIYVDYVNRTNTKFDVVELNEYWQNNTAVLSEEYFSTLFYFAREASDAIANTALTNKVEYEDLYGKNDTEILIYFLASTKFDSAIKEKDERKYNEAVAFAKKGLSKKWTDDILPRFEEEFYKTQTE